MTPVEVTFGIAFFAGLISFLLPCVFVLVPAFLSHIAGVSLSEISAEGKKARWKIFFNTVFFVIGFTVVFVLLGASLGFASRFIRDFQIWLARIGGALITFFGLVTMGLIKVPWLEREHKIKTDKKEIKAPSKEGASEEMRESGVKAPKSGFGYFSSFFVGSAFAIGWTPCVGPILGGILTLAATTGSIKQGALLLLAYSVGLMLPYLIIGFFTAEASSFIAKYSQYFKYINYVAGALLVLLGILIMTNQFARLVSFFYFINPPSL